MPRRKSFLSDCTENLLLAFTIPIPILQNQLTKYSVLRSVTQRRGSLRQFSTVQMAVPGTSADDLLIVGGGELGVRVGSLWRTAHPSARIVASTLGESRHMEIASHGLTPALSDSPIAVAKFPYVLFCAPPGKNETYVEDVSAAATQATVRFVFTSSTGVFRDDEIVTEETPSLDEPTKRIQRLLDAEDAARSTFASLGGVPLRLSGLYLRRRGAHEVWLKLGKVSGSMSGLLNLLHYEDAARAAIAALKAPEEVSGKVCVATDGVPVTRKDVCEIALRHPAFEGKSMPEFDEASGGSRKKIDGSWTRKALNWEPLWESFEEFMKSDADMYKRERAVELTVE